MDKFLDSVASAIRQQAEGGRSHGQLAVELSLERRMVCAIVRGERGVGGKSLASIIKAEPPWLREVLTGWLGCAKRCKCGSRKGRSE